MWDCCVLRSKAPEGEFCSSQDQKRPVTRPLEGLTGIIPEILSRKGVGRATTPARNINSQSFTEFLFFSPENEFFRNVDWVLLFLFFFFYADYKITHVHCKEKLEAMNNYLKDKTPQAASRGRLIIHMQLLIYFNVFCSGYFSLYFFLAWSTLYFIHATNIC